MLLVLSRHIRQIRHFPRLSSESRGQTSVSLLNPIPRFLGDTHETLWFFRILEEDVGCINQLYIDG